MRVYNATRMASYGYIERTKPAKPILDFQQNRKNPSPVGEESPIWNQRRQETQKFCIKAKLAVVKDLITKTKERRLTCSWTKREDKGKGLGR